MKKTVNIITRFYDSVGETTKVSNYNILINTAGKRWKNRQKAYKLQQSDKPLEINLENPWVL